MKRIVITVVVEDDNVDVQAEQVVEFLVSSVKQYVVEHYDDVEVQHTVETLW